MGLCRLCFSGEFIKVKVDLRVCGISQRDFINNYLTGSQAKKNTKFSKSLRKYEFILNVNRHNGFEMGLKIPLAVNSFYETLIIKG